MTISHCRDWTARELITNLLRQATENSIFGYAFLGNIIEYVRKYEMSPKEAEIIDDLTILKSLEPNRFLICDEDSTRVPTTYHMDEEYKMPQSFSQIKYTDFKVQYLAKNDPLSSPKQPHQNNENMEIDSDKKEEETKAIWIYFRRQGSLKVKRGEIRSVFYKDDSIKDIILRDVVSNLNLSINDKDQDQKDEKSD